MKIPWEDETEFNFDPNQTYPNLEHGEIEESWGASWAFSDKKYDKAIEIAQQLLEKYKNSDNSIEYYSIIVRAFMIKGYKENARIYLERAFKFYEDSRKHIYSSNYWEQIETLRIELDAL